MKKRLLSALLITALALSGCTKNDNTPSQNAVEEMPSPTIPPPPTATPIPTPIPIPDVMINAPEGWTELNRLDSSWVQTEWMDDSLETLEWMSDMGATIITTNFDKPAAEKAEDIFLRYEDAIKADVYAPHGDCEITMVAYENTVGLLISTKWEEFSYGCFVTGSVSNGIGMQALYDALGNFDKFNLYNYDLTKLMNHRISIDGESRSIDASYKKRLEETAAEATGWKENSSWMESVESIYTLLSSQRSEFETSASTVSETVYSNKDSIRVCDVHLPSGYQRLERYKEKKEGNEFECGVNLYGKNNLFTIEGYVPEEYLEYIDDYIWADDPEPTPEEEEVKEGEEGATATPTEEPEEEETDTFEHLVIFHEFDIPEGKCYIFLINNLKEDGTTTQDYMAVALNNINDTGCSMFVSSTVLDTKKKVIDLVERVFR